IIYALLGILSDTSKSKDLLPAHTKSLQQVIRDTASFLLSHTDQEQSFYNLLNWTLPEFLQSLDSLSSAVLRSASENRQEVIIELLLATGKVELETKDNSGRTPLSHAAQRGHEAIVKLLLEKQANVDLKDENGRMPLSYATESGHEAVARLLCEQGAEFEAKDRWGQTPLWRAAGNRHEGVMIIVGQ
ncbi:ankyrin repeat-containing domain protein, partial [Hyaloscypha sp. PMI_1271]